MTQVAHSEARQLAALLTEQRDVYRCLRELAGSQSAAVREDEPEALLRILAQRQALITRLTDINTRLEPFRSQWDRLREGLSPAERIRVGELVEEVQDLLGQILRQDDADSEQLQQRSKEVRTQAVAANVGRKLNNLYGAQAYGTPGPKFIDRKDEAARP